ncbi:hypothetical protein DQK91_12660 [Oceanidesulfovibrio marinus]|uniref:4Fe-4S ferredoxin-type domain-containing protein n=1 Tax=Oceanidesulfovibrio marinus TaxID=370038 RepID=A0A6P1ZET8_9BACT|nr:hypothetical protein DQK91_12660 [Oceanidesulfovibrio marinus]
MGPTAGGLGISVNCSERNRLYYRESHVSKKRINFSLGGCKQCEACVSIAPDCFEIDENTGMPFLKKECADEDVVRELCAYCPEDCIEMEDMEEE